MFIVYFLFLNGAKRGVDINVGNISVGNYFVQEVFRRFFRKWKSPFTVLFRIKRPWRLLNFCTFFLVYPKQYGNVKITCWPDQISTFTIIMMQHLPK